MNAKTIPIASVKPGLKDAVRMAVAEVNRFLCQFYPASAVARTEADKVIVGRWLSRVPGFHADDDFLHLVRDMLAYLQSGGQRSRVSDQLGYFFSGFMPTYGAACAFLEMAGTGDWHEVQAFMHQQAYGNARAYVQGFDWSGGDAKARAELQSWLGVVQAQAARLDEAKAAQFRAGMLASAAPNALPPSSLPPAANDPVMPRPAPQLRLLPGGAAEGAAEGAAAEEGVSLLRLLAPLAEAGPLLIPLVLLVVPGNIGQENHEDEFMQQLHQAEEQHRLLVRDVQATVTAAVNDANNECQPQRETNQRNGAKCENNGYVIMEQVLQYKRLVDPPKGRGLDGLFEKLPPMHLPGPMPREVTVPEPGKLVFIPTEAEPPNTRYDFTGRPPALTYPKFVVFEAKHIAQGHGENEHDDIKKTAKGRLKNTCDGQQLGTRWTEERIPQSLERQYPGGKNRGVRQDKLDEIRDARYARWLFACLPGPLGSNTKLFVLIDVVNSGMDLDSKAPVPRRKPSDANENAL